MLALVLLLAINFSTAATTSRSQADPARSYADHSLQARPADALDITATLVAVDLPEPLASCGIFRVQTPVRYRVLTGPAGLRGKQISAYISCLDFFPPFSARTAPPNTPVFEAGRVHSLTISRKDPANGENSDYRSGPLRFFAWKIEPAPGSG